MKELSKNTKFAKDFIDQENDESIKIKQDQWIERMIQKADEDEKKSESRIEDILQNIDVISVEEENHEKVNPYDYENLRETLENTSKEYMKFYTEQEETLHNKILDVIFLDQTYERMKQEGKTVQEFISHFQLYGDNGLIDAQNMLVRLDRNDAMRSYIGVAQKRRTFLSGFFFSSSVIAAMNLVFSSVLLSLFLPPLSIVFMPITIGLLWIKRKYIFASGLRSSNSIPYISFFENKMNDLSDHIERIDSRLAQIEKTQKLSEFSDSGFEKFIKDSTRIAKISIQQDLTKEMFSDLNK